MASSLTTIMMCDPGGTKPTVYILFSPSFLCYSTMYTIILTVKAFLYITGLGYSESLLPVADFYSPSHVFPVSKILDSCVQRL